MEKDKYPYRILVIEDNPGDYLLVTDYLEEHILAPVFVHANSYKKARKYLFDERASFDIILLDLSLPDKSRESLIDEVKAITAEIPIIVLTGFSDLSFAAKSISVGISDYLIKENSSSTALYKSVIYNIERFKFVKAIQDSEKKYSDLFHLSPIPMWVYDIETFRFLDVNVSAIQHYGYSPDEFLSMTIRDIRPVEDVPVLDDFLKKQSPDSESAYFEGVFRHKKKNGEVIFVDIRRRMLQFKGRRAKLILANDVSQRVLHIDTIEKQNKKLKEIAWFQSHVVRAPLARMMGLISALMEEDLDACERNEFLAHVIKSAHELDAIIKDVVDKSQHFKLLDDDDMPTFYSGK